MLRLVSMIHRMSRPFAAVSSVFRASRALMHSSSGDSVVQQWGTEEVAQWARGLGKHGPKIAEVITEKEITGEDLLDLTETDLKDLLGVGGPLARARKAIAALKGGKPVVEVPDKLRDPIVLASPDEDGKVTPMKVWSKEGFAQALKGGGFVTVQIGETEEQIIEWEALVLASRDPANVLVLGGGLTSKVSKLINYRRNRDTGLERITTSALVLDCEMLRLFSPVAVVNKGEGVIIYLKDENGNKGEPFMEVDGLVENTDVVFMNECKATLNKLHILGPDNVVERASRLQRVLRSLDKYISSPPDILRPLSRKRVIPVASTYKVDPGVRALCLEEGVVLVSRDGPGGSFIPTFPPSLLEGSIQL